MSQQKFKPTAHPRYLPGQVGALTIRNDLRYYNKHLKNLHEAKPVVDSNPPNFNPFQNFNGRKLHEDEFRSRTIALENENLLKRILEINRFGGEVDTINPLANRHVNKWRAYNTNMKKIEKHNETLYGVIKNPKCYYDNEPLKKEWERNLNQIKCKSRYPMILSRKSTLDKDLRIARSISCLQKCRRPELRPFCFLDFSIENGKFLGRIVIELYYDHVPVTVQNFLELCKGDKLTYKDNLVHRIILGEYMEMGDITQCNGRGGFSIYGKTFAEENHKLKHTKAGVLSMKRIGWTAVNNSQFCITFKKMERLDNKNVVFGNVIKGNDVLMNIQYYGRKIGKPLENIIISDCGEYFHEKVNK